MKIIKNCKKLLGKFLCIASVIVLTLALFSGCSNKETTVSGDADEDVTDYVYSEYITLADYIGVEAEQTIVEISDDDVQEYIDEEMTDYEEVDRAAGDGDYIVIDYDFYIDGELEEDWSDEGMSMVIGDYELYEEFDEALVGAKAGDVVEVEFTASDFGDEYADSEMYASVTVTEVYEVVVGEMTDEDAQEYGYDTVDDYKEAIKQELYDEENEYAVEEMEYSAWQTVLDNSEMNGYPDDLYEEQYEIFVSDLESTADMFGYDDVDTLMDEWGYTDDVIQESVEEYVKEYMIYMAIADIEGIEVTDEEYDEEMQEYLDYYEYDTVEEFEEDYDTSSIKDYVLYEKVMEFVADNAVVVEVEASDEDEEYY